MKKTLSNASAHDTHKHATDMDLLENPLTFLEEDHLRTRTICVTLDRLADAQAPARQDVFDALTYLENELPLLIVDEDADLDRLLRARAGNEATVTETLDRIADLHKDIAFQSRPALDLLELLKRKPRPLTYSEQDCLHKLAHALRVDMAVENAKLLPLARKHLSKEDIAELRTAMFQRRLSDFRDHRAPGA